MSETVRILVVTEGSGYTYFILQKLEPYPLRRTRPGTEKKVYPELRETEEEDEVDVTQKLRSCPDLIKGGVHVVCTTTFSKMNLEGIARKVDR